MKPSVATASTRFVLVLFVLVLVLVLGRSATAQQPVDPGSRRLELRARAGLLDQAFPGWIPIVVSIRNNGPALRARIEAAVRRYDKAMFTAERTIELPERASKREVLYVAVNNNIDNVVVEVRDAARPPADPPVARVEPGRFSVLSTWEYGSNAGHTLVHQVAIRDDPRDPRTSVSATYTHKNSTRFVVNTGLVEARDLPDRAIGYGSVDVLKLGDLDTGSITEQQRRAIVDWVENGGRVLLVAGDKGASFFEEPLVRGLLPKGATVKALELRGLPTTEKLLGSLPSEGVFRFYQCAGPGLEPVLEEERPTRDDRKLALFSRFRRGRGEVIVASVNLAAPPFDRWPGAGPAWAQLFLQLKGSLLSDRTRDNPLVQAEVAQALNAAESPSQLLVVLMVVVYIALVGPVNYLLCRRLDLHVLIVATTPLLAFLASGVVFVSGYVTKGLSSVVHRATFLETGSGREIAEERALVGVRSSTSGTYKVEFDPSLSPAQVFPSEDTARFAAQEVVEDGRFLFPGVPLNMWDHAFFDARGRRPLGGAVRIGREKTAWRVANGTTLSLGRGLLAYAEGQALKVQSLAPGDSLELTPPREASKSLPTDPQTIAAALFEGEDDRAFAARVLSHLPIERRGRPFYMAVLQNPPSAVSVDERDRATKALHLLIVREEASPQ